MVKVVALAVSVLVGVGLWAFEPWRLYTESTVDEPLPTVREIAADVPPPATPGGRTARPTPTPSPDPDPEPVELSRGGFEAAEHPTGGTARVIELADGSRFLRLEGLETSDGPDLYMWLSDQPSGGAWGSYDDGRYVELGALKATGGNQNYEIPADADLTGMRSVVIWCDRFNVAFGTAPVEL